MIIATTAVGWEVSNRLARQLVELYGARPDLVNVVAPGVDLDRFTPAAQGREAAVRVAARRRLGLPERGYVVAFVGRIQRLKAPDVLLRAVAQLPRPVLDRLTVAIAGGTSGSGLDLAGLAAHLGISRAVRFLPPQDHDRLPEGPEDSVDVEEVSLKEPRIAVTV